MPNFAFYISSAFKDCKVTGVGKSTVPAGASGSEGRQTLHANQRLSHRAMKPGAGAKRCVSPSFEECPARPPRRHYHASFRFLPGRGRPAVPLGQQPRADLLLLGGGPLAAPRARPVPLLRGQRALPLKHPPLMGSGPPTPCCEAGGELCIA